MFTVPPAPNDTLEEMPRHFLSHPRRALPVGRVVLAAALALATVPCFAVKGSEAHGSVPGVSVVVDHVGLPSLRVTTGVQVLEQITVANQGSETLSVLDDTGTPFLRIGPDGVFGNLSSPTWYVSNSASHAPPAGISAGVPSWLHVSTQPVWTWFDPRLHDASSLAEILATSGRPYGSWTIPVTSNVVPGVQTIVGHHRYVPPRLTPRATVESHSPGLRVQAVTGQLPALLATVTGSDEVTIVGTRGEAFAMGTAAGWSVNEASPTWRLDGVLRSQPISGLVDASAPPRWRALNDGPNFVWNDPRIQATASVSDTGAGVLHWRIPVRVGSSSLAVDGTTVLVPLPAGGGAPQRGFRAATAPLAAGLGLAAGAVSAGVGVWAILRRRQRSPARTPSGSRGIGRNRNG